jgi:uncharacterized protein
LDCPQIAGFHLSTEAAFIITGLTERRSSVAAFVKRLVCISRPTSRFLIYSLSPLLFLGLAIVVALAIRAPLPPLSEFAIYSGLPPLGLPAVLLLVLLFNGFGEKAGWRGFALEPLQRRYGPVVGNTDPGCLVGRMAPRRSSSWRPTGP